jgi:IS1 family transposase
LSAARLKEHDYWSIYQVFAKQVWNKINTYFEANNPEALKNKFTDKIGTTTIIVWV